MEFVDVEVSVAILWKIIPPGEPMAFPSFYSNYSHPSVQQGGKVGWEFGV